MKNTSFEEFLGTRLPRQIQLKRLRQVLEEELTPLQRETVIACYFQNKSQAQFARERGVNKSTGCRNLKRAEQRLRRFLNY